VTANGSSANESSTNHYDVIVVGVGGMGSAACYALAERGARVLGLEQYDIPHAYGSSHGETRIIRLAYAEGAFYVPLLQRSYERWRRLERDFGETLLHITGGLDIGAADSALLQGALHSCREHDLPHELLTATAAMARFPALQLPPHFVALHQPEGGFLRSERCIVAHVTRAQAVGAEIRAREAVLRWEARGDAIHVKTTKGEYAAERLVITAGGWAGQLLPELAPFAQPERQCLGWFQPLDLPLFQPERLPVWLLYGEGGEGNWYGFPVHGIPGFKLGKFRHLGEPLDLSADREPNETDEALLRRFTEKYFPRAAGPTMSLKVCFFTNTPDEHFIIDTHPEHANVIVAAGFSGHGFKFCSVVGETLADLALAGGSEWAVEEFGLGRFGL